MLTDYLLLRELTWSEVCEANRWFSRVLTDWGLINPRGLSTSHLCGQKQCLSPLPQARSRKVQSEQSSTTHYGWPVTGELWDYWERNCHYTCTFSYHCLWRVKPLNTADDVICLMTANTKCHGSRWLPVRNRYMTQQHICDRETINLYLQWACT